MEDEDFYEPQSNNKPLIIPVIITIAVIVIFSILFFNYKQEILKCSKSKDVCYIEKVNLVNYKSRKKFLKYSDIGKIAYITQTVSGNIYAKGYTSYLLTIYTKKNDPVVVFSTEYFEYKDAADAIKDINKLMKSADDTFEYKR